MAINHYLHFFKKMSESLYDIFNQANTEHDLWELACHQLVQTEHYKMAWVGSKSDHARIVPIASFGDVTDYLSQITIHWEDDTLGNGPSGIAIRTGQTVVWKDLESNPHFAPWRQLALKNQFSAVASVPLANAGESPWGILNVYTVNPDELNEEKLQMLELWASHLVIVSDLAKKQRYAKHDRKLLDLVMNHMLDVIIQVNNSDHILFISPSVERILGYPPDHLVDAHLFDYIHPDDQHHYAAWRNQLTKSSNSTVEVRVLQADGSFVWSELIGQANLNLSYASSELIIIIREISKLKVAQNEMKRLAAVAENTDKMVVITDPHRHIEWVNDSFSQVTGYQLQEAIGHKPGDLLNGPDKDDAIVQFMHDKLEDAEGFQVELINYKKSGIPYWVSIDIRPVFNETGELEHFIAIESDITEHKAELSRMKAENEILRWIQRMSDILFFIDRIQSVYSQFRDMAIQLLGIQAGVYIVQDGDSWHVEDWFGLDGIQIESFSQHIEEDASEPLGFNEDHYRFIQRSDRLKKEDGTHSIDLVAEFRYDIYLEQHRHSVLYLYYIQPDAVLRPIVLSLMEFFRLALQVVTQRELLKNQNEQDPLTLISNRRGLEAFMESYFTSKNPVPSVFLLFDLDGFKQLNDSLGHQHGDHALKAIAHYFKQNIRANGDWIARLGGDEFVLVLYDTAWDKTLIDRLARQVEESPLEQRGLSLTMGAVVLPKEANNFQEAYRLADERLYRGKQDGKNRMTGPNNETILFHP